MARIIIIDDDAVIRKMLQSVIENMGHEVVLARSGNEGIKFYKQNKADLIITDIVMPDKEGIETIFELKQKYQDVKIIAMSGGGRIKAEEYLKLAKSFGAMHTIAKPIDVKELINLIKQIL